MLVTLDASLQRRRHDCLHALQQHWRVTLGRILGTIEGFAGNGAFGQAFHGEIVKFATLDDLYAWRDAIIGKPSAAADSDLVTCHGISRRCLQDLAIRSGSAVAAIGAGGRNYPAIAAVDEF